MRAANEQSPDPVARAIDTANELLRSRGGQLQALAALIGELESLPTRELRRFDEQARSYLSGLRWAKVPDLRRGFRKPAGRLELWGVLALVSGDGHERERAVRAVPLRPLTARLILLRCVDWVQEVRTAALERLDEFPADAVLGSLALAEQLAEERSRGQLLGAYLDTRIGIDDLRGACRSKDPLIRRAAWRRLVASGSASADELATVAAAVTDLVVRRIAARVLPNLPKDTARELAQVLIRDRSGAVSSLALATLVQIDGDGPIAPALTAASPELHQHRGIDAINGSCGLRGSARRPKDRPSG